MLCSTWDVSTIIEVGDNQFFFGGETVFKDSAVTFRDNAGREGPPQTVHNRS